MEKRQRPLKSWVKHYKELKGHLRILYYSDLHGSFERGAFIFSDFDRLPPRVAATATKVCARLRRAGCSTLNLTLFRFSGQICYAASLMLSQYAIS
jgi:hypothetical protein